MSVRVYQLAKQLGLDNKHVVQLLRERGLDVSGPSNTIPSIYADALIEEIGNKKLVFVEEKGEKEKPVTTPDLPAENIKEEEEKADDIIISAPEETADEVEEVIDAKSISSGFETKEIELNENAEDAQAKAEIKKPIVTIKPKASIMQKLDRPKKLAITHIKETENSKKVNEPEVKLPALQKESTTSIQEVEKKLQFKPFLKKIERQTTKIADLKTLEIKPPIVIRTLATQMNVKPFQLISKLMSMNIFASMNQEIDILVAQNVAEKFGYTLELAKPEVEKVSKPKQNAKKSAPSETRSQKLKERAPIVCVLGHVDHGKTTLLDTIRHARVAAGEAGGITQHVAAYQVEQGGKKITFIDTPGHAAFSKMRERGANITDIGVLVVAADDGFMPQTDEALKFAKNANIPVVVAINKIDAKGANIDKVKQQMQQRGITSEDWGGETLCAPISALNGTNIDGLLELIKLQAEIMELQADESGHPEGVVLESKVALGQGPTASAIIQDGVLKVGDCLVCGTCYCKVRSLANDLGKQIKSAPASTPVNIIGWSDVPDVGAKFTFAENEKVARKIAEENALAFKKSQSERPTNINEISSIDQLFSAIAAVEEKVLNVILRADVHGSAEALHDFLKTIKSKKIKLNILDCGVGSINKNDIVLADTSNAQIVAFNVKVETNAQALAKQLGVKIIQHNIIYEIVDKVRDAMAECLDPELQENKLGAAEIRQIFKVKNDVVAGCMVIEGKIVRDKFVRIIRKKEIIFQGKFHSIKRQREDVSEVRAGFECGIIVAGFEAFDTEDIIECFEIKKIQPSL